MPFGWMATSPQYPLVPATLPCLADRDGQAPRLAVSTPACIEMRRSFKAYLCRDRVLAPSAHSAHSANAKSSRAPEAWTGRACRSFLRTLRGAGQASLASHMDSVSESMGKIEVTGWLVLDDKRSAEVRAPCHGVVVDLPSVVDVSLPRVVLVFTSSDRFQAQQRFLASKHGDAQSLLDLGMQVDALAWVEAHRKPIVKHKLSCPKGHAVFCSLGLGQAFSRGERLYSHGLAIQARCRLPDELAKHVAPLVRARLYPRHLFGGTEFIPAQVADIRGCGRPGMKEVILNADPAAVRLPLHTELDILIDAPRLTGRRRAEDLLAAQEAALSVRLPQIIRGANRPVEIRRAEAEMDKAREEAAATAAPPPDPVPDRPKPATYEVGHSAKRTRRPGKLVPTDGDLTQREWERAGITTVTATERILRPSITVLAVRLASGGEVGSIPDPVPTAGTKDGTQKAAALPGRLELRLSASEWARLSRADIAAEIHRREQPVIDVLLPVVEARNSSNGSHIVQLPVPRALAALPTGAGVWLRLRCAETIAPCLAVPRSAVLCDVNGSRVLLHAGPGRLVPSEVIVGLEADGWIEVRRGLRAGDALAFDIKETVHAVALAKGVTAAAARAEDWSKIRSGRSRR